VVTVSYEVTDATIDSQAISLQAENVDVLISAATPKFASQIIRKVADMQWKPLHILSDVSSSVGAVIDPAGPEKAVGLICCTY
jgi:branched-chain amino acid transport system substrate-binding protein